MAQGPYKSWTPLPPTLSGCSLLKEVFTILFLDLGSDKYIEIIQLYSQVVSKVHKHICQRSCHEVLNDILFFSIKA
jgi:hypothetical protein